MTARMRAAIQHLVLALVAYVPLLLTAPGRVAADTKTYLYLDPSRLLSRALSMWDPHIGLGTVTHQNIGYAWPMGPWFWAFESLGSPDWVAQRLWLGTVLLAAGAGVLFLLRTLGVARRSPVVQVAAALVYLCSPFVLHYAARISVLLLPWAAMPWLVALVERTLRARSWRHPAAFALVVTTVGSVNATALVLAGLAPLLWLVFAATVHGTATWREAWTAAWRIGALTVVCSAWWIAGLAVQGGYGIDILRYTETVETVSRTSLASEVVRGLGYWFFYGGDKLGPWIEPGRSYTQDLWLIALGFVLPIAALVTAVLVRWRYRAFAITLAVLGTAIAVGAYPYDDPSPIGAAFKALATSSTAGLALRSTPRAIPLLALGIALLLAAGLAALRPRVGVALAVVTGVVAAAGVPPLWSGDMIGENLQRPEEIPGYWEEAASWLDARGDATRVLAVPGTEFAAYRWGNTVDPILPGLMDRPFVGRELIPYGTEAAADLLIALDRRFQEGVLDPEALAPVARLLGVGDVLFRGDLQYERYRTPRPGALWSDLTEPVPAGLDEPTSFGSAVNEAIDRLPLHDEVFLATDPSATAPPPVAAFPVEDPLPIVRSRAASGAVLLAGDGEGVVDAAAAGLVAGDGVVLYSAALAGRSGLRRSAVEAGAELVLTDTNRRRARRWNSVRDNTGYTEQAGEEPLVEDPSDNRLPVFPDAGEEAFTVVEHRGVEAVQASDYANAVSYTANDRPANAFDGDASSAWRTGGLEATTGEFLELRTAGPVTADRITVVQPLNGPRNRWITEVGVELDGERVGSFGLDESSRSEDGQALDLGRARAFSTLRLTIEDDNVGRQPLYDPYSAVGFAEVRVPGVAVDEVTVLPRDLLDGASADNPLTVLLTRLRGNPREPVKTDEESRMVRSFELPVGRSFRLDGQARLSAFVGSDLVDRLLGVVGPEARASRFLPGDLPSRASAAIDGDRATAWSNGFGPQVGDWIDVDLPGGPIDHLDLELVADGFHSVPTRFVVTTDAGDRHVVDVPAVEDGGRRGATAAATVRFPAIAGRSVRLTIDAIRPVRTNDWYSARPIDMPVAIAEVGVPGLPRPSSTGLDAACRDDLLTVDGRPVRVRLSGDVEAAVQRDALRLEGCDELELGAGEHLVRTADGARTGVDVDRLALRSASRETLAAAPPGVRVVRSGATSFDVQVEPSDEPFWLVLGQSNSAGWTGRWSSGGRDGELGRSVVVDGYANGWRLPASDEPYTVELRWTPQRTVEAGIGVSLAGVLVCLAILAAGARRRTPLPEPAAARPRLRRPWWRTGPPASARRTALGAAVAGVGAGLVVDPVVGLVVAAAAVLALRLPAGRAIGVAAPLLVTAAMVVTVVIQWRNDYPPDFGWADFFGRAHRLAWGGLWAAVVLLLTDRLRPSTDKSQGHPLDPHSPPPR